MDLNLYAKQRVRVKTSHGPFLDLEHVGYESLAIDMYSFQGYIEIRKKGTHLRIFQFPKKSYKKECDFGYWEDGEVVFSYNEHGKDKDEK